MKPDTISKQRRKVPASEILAKILQNQPVEYDDVIIEGDLDLRGLDLPTEHVGRTEYEKMQRLSEERKIIGSKITITKSEIRGNVIFNDVHFNEEISFFMETKGNTNNKILVIGPGTPRTEFKGIVNLNGVKFDRNINFRLVKFGGYASFDGSEFGGDANFFLANFGMGAGFGRVLVLLKDFNTTTAYNELG